MARTVRAASTANTARTTEHLPPWLRRHRVEILLWAFREGRRLDSDALTAVLGAKHARVDEPFSQWTHAVVRELLWCEVADWCLSRHLPTPPTVAVTIWAVLDFLEAADGLDTSGSDPVGLLRAPLIDSGGLGLDGRPRTRRRSRPRHPSTHRAG